jgi:hypothetical protein
MTEEYSTDRSDLNHMLTRVREKLKDHVRYNFSHLENNLLKSFFDLIQEYDGLDDFYRICVTVLLESMQVESALYLLDHEGKQLKPVCNSREGIIREPRSIPTGIYISDQPYKTENSYVVPIYRKPPTNLPENDTPGQSAQHLWQDDIRILGMFEISPLEKLNDEDLFFLGKYANRIGFRLHNRLLAQQNIHHLKFINNLVMDIEHNVIIPNMYFKHLFNQLRRKIGEMQELETEMNEIKKGDGVSDEACRVLINRLSILRGDLLG